MSTPLKVGLAGLGTVGTAVMRLIAERYEVLRLRGGRGIELVAVSARSRAKKRDADLDACRWVDDPVALARDPEIDVFVELMGGEGDPAHSAVREALAAGKSVVTANKALLARHGPSLAALAERYHASLHFEAAVGAAIPIVKTLRESMHGNAIERVYGILNGTCNYILTRMERERLSFDECLKEAQRLGYAEADPTFDIEGYDTAQKLAILASLAFGTRIDPDAVYVEGISSITLADLDAADELGYRVKLLGVAVRTEAGIEQRVHPSMVPKSSAIAQVMDVTNAITVDAAEIDPITLVGPGAGGMATACAVVSDITDIARGVRSPPFGRPSSDLAVSGKAPMQRHEGGYYIRLLARDRPGTAAVIATRLAENNISLESIVQKHSGAHQQGGERVICPPGQVPVILITYATTEDAVRAALAAVEADGVIAETPQLIRIEKD
jgi:homoserine dehydrogenase